MDAASGRSPTVNVKNVKALVETGKLVRYRVNTKATLVLED